MYDSALFFITEAYSVVKVCVCVCAPLFALLQDVSLVLHSQPAPLGLNHIPGGKTATSKYRLLCTFNFFFLCFLFRSLQVCVTTCCVLYSSQLLPHCSRRLTSQKNISHYT